MYSTNGRRARRGIPMVAILGAVAVLALSGLALARGHHGGHHRHGPDTGTIASFDAGTGVLAIELSGGGTVSGLVGDRTRIKCEDAGAPDASRRGREGEPGDDRGGHGNEAGDDHGGRSNEPGDDNGGEDSGPGPSGHDDNGVGANCTTADLTAGAVVHEAKLDLKNGKAVFHEVELAASAD